MGPPHQLWSAPLVGNTPAMCFGAHHNSRKPLTTCSSPFPPFPFFLYLFLARPQTYHYSASQADLVVETSPYTVYGCNESVADSLPWDGVTPRKFVSTWNESSRLYYATGINEIMEKIPFQRLFQVNQPDSTTLGKNKRGNYQVNFGHACGCSTARRTDDNVREHLGVAVPSKLNGTEDPLIVQTITAMSELAQKVCVQWTMPDYLEAHGEVKNRLDLFAKKLAPNGVVEHITVAFLKLDDGKSKLLKHVDSKNCPHLTEVVTAKSIVRDDYGW